MSEQPWEGEAEAMFTTGGQAGPDASGITIESLNDTMKQMDLSLMDSELEILMKDNGPAILSLLHGGQLVEVGGKCFVLSREFTGYSGFGPPRPIRF